MSAHIRLLPISPLKMNILQNNSGLVNNANLLKISHIIAAKADSTNNSEPSSDEQTPVAIDPRTGVPFKKHHHSVKKFQTPSVSRRNARERNRVKQVNKCCNFFINFISFGKVIKVNLEVLEIDNVTRLKFFFVLNFSY